MASFEILPEWRLSKSSQKCHSRFSKHCDLSFSNTHDALILIAGHYDFPNQPSKFAINSIKTALDISKERENANVLVYSFINDMRYNNLCSYGFCSINSNNKLQNRALVYNPESVLPRIFVDELKNRLHAGGIWSFASCFLKQYEEYINDSEKDLPPTLDLKNYCMKILNGYQPQDDSEFCQFYDQFMYMFDKEGFIPYAFEFEIDVNCKTLYEKNVFNSVSKTIKKMQKHEELELFTRMDGNKTIYECNGFDNKRILLRIEDRTSNFQAINKCPSIIANLYYRLIKANIGYENYTLAYIVPSYDRSKVNLGSQAFYSLYYPYLVSQYNNLADVQIINISWGDEMGINSMIDTFSNNNCTHQYKHV